MSLYAEWIDGEPFIFFVQIRNNWGKDDIGRALPDGWEKIISKDELSEISDKYDRYAFLILFYSNPEHNFDGEIILILNLQENVLINVVYVKNNSIRRQNIENPMLLLDAEYVESLTFYTLEDLSEKDKESLLDLEKILVYNKRKKRGLLSLYRSGLTLVKRREVSGPWYLSDKLRDKLEHSALYLGRSH